MIVGTVTDQLTYLEYELDGKTKMDHCGFNEVLDIKYSKICSEAEIDSFCEMETTGPVWLGLIIGGLALGLIGWYGFIGELYNKSSSRTAIIGIILFCLCVCSAIAEWSATGVEQCKDICDYLDEYDNNCVFGVCFEKCNESGWGPALYINVFGVVSALISACFISYTAD